MLCFKNALKINFNSEHLQSLIGKKMEIHKAKNVLILKYLLWCTNVFVIIQNNPSIHNVTFAILERFLESGMIFDVNKWFLFIVYFCLNLWMLWMNNTIVTAGPRNLSEVFLLISWLVCINLNHFWTKINNSVA